MEQQNNQKIYCGSGKEFGQYGTINCSICLNDIPKEFWNKGNNGKTYLPIKINRKREVDQYGKTHSVEVDTWKPTQQQGQQQQAPQSNQQAFQQQGHPMGFDDFGDNPMDPF